MCEQVRQAEPQALSDARWMFDDLRLEQLLPRYKARNFPDTLSADEQLAWQAFCRDRLCRPEAGAPLTLDGFAAAMGEALAQADADQHGVLMQWQAYVDQLRQRLAITGV
jgi:exodeoxyribonuclease-1